MYYNTAIHNYIINLSDSESGTASIHIPLLEAYHTRRNPLSPVCVVDNFLVPPVRQEQEYPHQEANEDDYGKEANELLEKRVHNNTLAILYCHNTRYLHKV